MRLQSMLQCHRQAIRQKSDQDVRLHPMLQLMIDGTNPQLALQTLNAASICTNCMYRSHSTAGSSAIRLVRSR